MKDRESNAEGGELANLAKDQAGLTNLPYLAFETEAINADGRFSLLSVCQRLWQRYLSR
jgi:hypothetical protein